MRETDTHIYFWGGWMSNFHPCKVVLFNKEWKSSEHAYMAAKAHFFKDFKAFEEIADVPTAKEAKAIGRKVKGFDADIWNDQSYSWMFMAVTSKFIHNKNLAKKLIETGNKIIVEASPIDKIWGVGLHEDDDLILDEKNWLGENRLGKVIMNVRSEL